MKAIVYTKYGSPNVLQLKEVEKPEPKHNEILIRIKATAVNSGDIRLRKADPFAVRLFFGLFKPKINILGGVFSGEIESIGSDVQRIRPTNTTIAKVKKDYNKSLSIRCGSSL